VLEDEINCGFHGAMIATQPKGLTDTIIAVVRLLFSGHLTRFPGVSLVLAHAGGALPYALGRLPLRRRAGAGAGLELEPGEPSGRAPRNSYGKG
jgi:predicted TIM-barrel fold metal-dependent hydrolase